MSTPRIEQLQKEIEQLGALLQGYYVAAQIGKQMEDPSDYEVRQYEELIDSLQQQAAPLLGVTEEDREYDLECECGATIEGLIRFFGPKDYQELHIADCPGCGEHTLHVGDESQRCVNPSCKHRSSIDAEGNVYVNGVITSNGGKSVDQLRDEYFASEGLL